MGTSQSIVINEDKHEIRWNNRKYKIIAKYKYDNFDFYDIKIYGKNTLSNYGIKVGSSIVKNEYDIMKQITTRLYETQDFLEYNNKYYHMFYFSYECHPNKYRFNKYYIDDILNFLMKFHKINRTDPYEIYTNCINPDNFYDFPKLIQLNAKKHNNIAQSSQNDIEMLLLMLLCDHSTSLEDINDFKQNLCDSKLYKACDENQIKALIQHIIKQFPLDIMIRLNKNYHGFFTLDGSYIYDFFIIENNFINNLIQFNKTDTHIHIENDMYDINIFRKDKNSVYLDERMPKCLNSMNIYYLYDINGNMMLKKTKDYSIIQPKNIKVYMIMKFIECCHAHRILVNIRQMSDFKLSKSIKYTQEFYPQLVYCDYTKFSIAKDAKELTLEKIDIERLWNNTDKFILKGKKKIIDASNSVLYEENNIIYKLYKDYHFACSIISEYNTLKKLNKIDPIHFVKVQSLMVYENKYDRLFDKTFNGSEFLYVYSMEKLEEMNNFIDDLKEEHQFKKLACDILTALKVMHSNDISHQDIKPDNICRRNKDYVLIDFGSSEKISINKYVLGYGTLNIPITLHMENISYCDYEAFGYTLGFFTESFAMIKKDEFHVIDDWIPKDPYVKQYMDEIKKGNFDPDELIKIFM